MRSGRTISRYSPWKPTSPQAAPFSTKRYLPPTRRSISHTGMVAPSIQHHQRRTRSGLVMTSNTRARGASNTRESTISLSEGRVTLSLPLLLASMAFLLLQLFEQTVEALEVRFHLVAVALEPVGDFAQRCRLQAARTALRVTTARDQPGALEHLDVLRDGRLAHVVRLGELQDGGLALDQAREDRAAGRVGQGHEGRVEPVGARSRTSRL